MSRHLVPSRRTNKPKLPAGHTEITSSLEAATACRTWGGLAIEVLSSIAGDHQAPALARVAAAGKILERAFGRHVPIQQDENGFTDLRDDDLSLLSDDFHGKSRSQSAL
jgi:hypothetical protein